MTKETLQELIKIQEDVILSARETINQLKEKFIREHKRFNIGDRVSICSLKKATIRFGYIFDIKVSSWSNDIEYVVKKEKKDGTQSMVNDHIYSNETLDKSPK